MTTGFMPLSSLLIVSTIVIWESSQWFGKKFCADYWSKELQESMDRCTGHTIYLFCISKQVQNTTTNISIFALQRENEASLAITAKEPSRDTYCKQSFRKRQVSFQAHQISLSSYSNKTSKMIIAIVQVNAIQLCWLQIFSHYG